MTLVSCLALPIHYVWAEELIRHSNQQSPSRETLLPFWRFVWPGGLEPWALHLASTADSYLKPQKESSSDIRLGDA